MSTFSQPAAADTPKDNATKEEISDAKAQAAGSGDDGKEGDAKPGTIPATDSEKPIDMVGETDDEKADRHVASEELEVERVTDPDTQADTPLADQVKDHIVPGAAVGPDAAGVIRNEHGKVADAPPGTLNAAYAGVQQDAAGHVDSVGTDNSSKSGVRI